MNKDLIKEYMQDKDFLQEIQDFLIDNKIEIESEIKKQLLNKYDFIGFLANNGYNRSELEHLTEEYVRWI